MLNVNDGLQRSSVDTRGAQNGEGLGQGLENFLQESSSRNPYPMGMIAPDRSLASSAPPTVESMLYSNSSFHDGSQYQGHLPSNDHSGLGGEKDFIVDEDRRRNPAYISQYYAEFNMNPRNPPLVSREKYLLAKRMESSSGMIDRNHGWSDHERRLHFRQSQHLPTHLEENDIDDDVAMMNHNISLQAASDPWHKKENGSLDALSLLTSGSSHRRTLAEAIQQEDYNNRAQSPVFFTHQRSSAQYRSVEALDLHRSQFQDPFPGHGGDDGNQMMNPILRTFTPGPMPSSRIDLDHPNGLMNRSGNLSGPMGRNQVAMPSMNTPMAEMDAAMEALSIHPEGSLRPASATPHHEDIHLQQNPPPQDPTFQHNPYHMPSPHNLPAQQPGQQPPHHAPQVPTQQPQYQAQGGGGGAYPYPYHAPPAYDPHSLPPGYLPPGGGSPSSTQAPPHPGYPAPHPQPPSAALQSQALAMAAGGAHAYAAAAAAAVYAMAAGNAPGFYYPHGAIIPGFVQQGMHPGMEMGAAGGAHGGGGAPQHHMYKYPPPAGQLDPFVAAYLQQQRLVAAVTVTENSRNLQGGNLGERGGGGHGRGRGGHGRGSNHGRGADPGAGENRTKGSGLLEEVKGNKMKKYDLMEIVGHVVEFSMDQHGSRFIQQKLETATDEDKEIVFREVHPKALNLMTDVFGNYVIQKFFEHGLHAHRQELATMLTGHVLQLSLQMYGCRVIQKALEVLEGEQQMAIVAELNGNVMRCVRDQNGNHVVQKCIECVPGPRIQFIIQSFRGQVVQLSTHPYGCRVIQRVLEHCASDALNPSIMEEILTSTCTLAQDQYGNYVVQHVLEHGSFRERDAIIRQLAGQIVVMSRHKFASNVVEKCLVFSTPEQRQVLIKEMLGDTDANEPLQAMMKDQFANYVVQKVLETCSEGQRELLVGRIREHLHSLKKFTYGKHIVSRLEKFLASGGRLHGRNVQARDLREAY